MTQGQETAEADGGRRGAFGLAALLALAVLAVGLWYSGLWQFLTLDELARNRGTLRAFVEAHAVWSLLLYMAGYAAAVALSVPGAAVLTILGGFLFGSLFGALAAATGAVAGGTLFFLLARSAFGRFMARGRSVTLAKIMDGIRGSAFSYLLFLRLMPVFPFWFVNLAAALCRIPLVTFLAATVIGILPASLAYSAIGAGFDEVAAAHEAALAACADGSVPCPAGLTLASLARPELLAGLAALGVIALLPAALRAWRGRADAERFDLCIIGAGSGGLSAAAVAAQFGRKVALIERGEMGGDCLNTGCVPSKTLLAQARKAAARDRAPAAEDYGAAMETVAAVITRIAPQDSQERFTALGCTVIRGSAAFTAPDRVSVDGREISARRFIVATGSKPSIPDIPGLAGLPYLTHETLFALRERPRHLLILGAGPIGLEMAQAHRRFGCEVTVVEAAQPLAKDDPEAAAVVITALRREGVRLIAPARITALEAGPSGGISALITQPDGTAERLEASHLLIAAGRQARIDGLGLEAAGIAHDTRGIHVNAGLRTSNRRVFAIGDVTGGFQFTHAANYHAGLAIRSVLFRLPVRADARVIPWVTYTEPELAQAGMTQAQARRSSPDVRILTWPFSSNDRAEAEGATEGFVKVMADRRGRILGATIVGPQAGELIQIWALAIANGLKLRHIASTVFPYPTRGEASKRAAISAYAELAQRPAIRRLAAILALFG